MDWVAGPALEDQCGTPLPNSNYKTSLALHFNLETAHSTSAARELCSPGALLAENPNSSPADEPKAVNLGRRVEAI